MFEHPIEKRPEVRQPFHWILIEQSQAVITPDHHGDVRREHGELRRERCPQTAVHDVLNSNTPTDTV
jgi:hypothetical protein